MNEVPKPDEEYQLQDGATLHITRVVVEGTRTSKDGLQTRFWCEIQNWEPLIKGASLFKNSTS